MFEAMAITNAIKSSVSFQNVLLFFYYGQVKFSVNHQSENNKKIGFENPAADCYDEASNDAGPTTSNTINKSENSEDILNEDRPLVTETEQSLTSNRYTLSKIYLCFLILFL